MRRDYLALIVAVASYITPVAAKADTFTPYPTVNLGFGRGTLLGLTATGVQVSILPDGTGSCASASDVCYSIFDPATSSTFDTNTPAVGGFDNGGPCAPSAIPAYFAGFQAVCNGKHEVFAGRTDPNDPYAYTIYLGTNGPGYVFSEEEITDVEVDRLGDVSFNLINLGLGPDQVGGFIDESTRVAATPEPDSLFLLGTGLAGLVAMAKNRKQLLRQR